MNRNAEKHFANVPSIDIQRSTFTLEQEHKTTFNVGDIIPFFTYTDILPGDTFKVNLSFVMRLQTPINPTMDNLYADIYWFYDRTRNTWIHFREFMGENNASAWNNQTQYNVPTWQISTNNYSNATKTLWDYMGLRTGVYNVVSVNHPDFVPINAFALRSYIRCYNRFFRDENLIAPITENTGDNATILNINNNYSGKVLKASRFADYFSKCLPGPQKGQALIIPLGSSAPVLGNGNSIMLTDGTNISTMANYTGNDIWLSPSGDTTNVPAGTSSSPAGGLNNSVTIGLATSGDTGLYADLSQAIGATVNALRLSIQTQRILETDARRGTRFPELISAHFKTIAPDATIDYPEYLGGTRVPINITAVANTTGTNDAPQGYLGAFSHTVDSSYMFTKSFTEWGTLLGLVVVRAEHSYSQGYNRMWTRQNRLDYYWPTLAHLGEQPVYNYEIYATASNANNGANNQVFGYQERWAEYRYLPNIISGEMRPDYAQSLDVWHYGDDYSSLPVLSQQWLEEPTTYVGRTLAVQNQDQILADFNTQIIATRPMPTYSVPGLVDHF